jgi:hypothetical protein
MTLSELLAVHAQLAVYEGPPVVPLAECWPLRFGAAIYAARWARFCYVVEVRPLGGVVIVDAVASEN